MIKDVLSTTGEWKIINDFPYGQRPVYFELTALKNAIGDSISEYKNKCGKAYVDCIREIKPIIGNYNIYGRIVFKKEKGYSHFYKLLCASDKNNGWVTLCNGMDRGLTEFNPGYNFEQEIFFDNVKKIMSLNTSI